MKKLFILLVAITALYSSKAQKVNDLKFGVNTGVSVPIGDFNSSGSDPEKVGFATNGFFMNFTGNYRVNSSWTLVGMIHYNQNTLNNEEMQPFYLNELGKVMDATVDSGDRIASDTPDWQDSDNVFYDSDDWMGTSVLIGGKYTLPIKRWTWEVQALGGIQYTLLPIHTLRVRDVSKPYFWAHHAINDNDFSFAGMASTAIRMPLTAKTQLRFSVDYYFTRVDVNQEIAEFSNGSQNLRTENVTDLKYKLNYTTLNAGIGIIYNF